MTINGLVVKGCDYCHNRIVAADRPYEVEGFDTHYNTKRTYDLCLRCHTRFKTFKKTTVYEFIESRYQKCCTEMRDRDNCCEDHYPDDEEHECLEDIEQIILE